MLDLNVNITATDLSYDDEKAKTLEAEKLPQMEEDSGTSNSSVVNAEEAPTPSNAADEDSSNTTSSYIFDILKKEKDGLCNAYGAREETQSQELATRSLFPVTGGKEAECGFGLSSSSRPQWLNLSFTDSGGQAELRIMQQQQQTRQQPPPPPQPRKSRRGPRSRSSQYRGVTFYRRTGRWESHIWDCGKQVYLGGFDTAHSAAKAYDRAAIKFRGVDADINFSLSDYEEDMKQMRHLNKEEFVHVLRRQSNGASRASSKYRGVTLPKCGQWETGRGQFLGKKVFEKAAPPAIKCNGREGVANFDPGTYEGEIILDASIEGRGHNLDLSLGISQPSNGQKANGNLGGFQLGGNAFEMSNKERPMGNGSASGPVGGQPAHVLAMLSKHPAIYSGIYPGFLQKHEEMVTDHHQRVVPQAVSSPRFTNWAWQIHGNSSDVTPMPVFSVAASSGFSSSSIASTTPPIPLANNQLPPNLQANYSAYNFCLPFPTME